MTSPPICHFFSYNPVPSLEGRLTIHHEYHEINTCKAVKPIIRNNARAILLNQHGQFLLFRFHFDSHPGPLWVTPGGGVEQGEDFESTLMRELYEETGMQLTSHARWVWTRDKQINAEPNFISHERYFLLHVDDSTISLEHLTENEKSTLVGYKWWTPEEVAASDDEFSPHNIGELVKELQAGNIPQKPIRIE